MSAPGLDLAPSAAFEAADEYVRNRPPEAYEHYLAGYAAGLRYAAERLRRRRPTSLPLAWHGLDPIETDEAADSGLAEHDPPEDVTEK